MRTNYLLALTSLWLLALASAAPKKLEKKSIANSLAPKAAEPVEQKLEEPSSKISDEALMETTGDTVDRAKKQASTTFCVEVRQNKPTQVDCNEANGGADKIFVVPNTQDSSSPTGGPSGPTNPLVPGGHHHVLHLPHGPHHGVHFPVQGGGSPQDGTPATIHYLFPGGDAPNGFGPHDFAPNGFGPHGPFGFPMGGAPDDGGLNGILYQLPQGFPDSGSNGHEPNKIHVHVHPSVPQGGQSPTGVHFHLPTGSGGSPNGGSPGGPVHLSGIECLCAGSPATGRDGEGNNGMPSDEALAVKFLQDLQQNANPDFDASKPSNDNQSPSGQAPMIITIPSAPQGTPTTDEDMPSMRSYGSGPWVEGPPMMGGLPWMGGVPMMRTPVGSPAMGGLPWMGGLPLMRTPAGSPLMGGSPMMHPMGGMPIMRAPAGSPMMGGLPRMGGMPLMRTSVGSPMMTGPPMTGGMPMANPSSGSPMMANPSVMVIPPVMANPPMMPNPTVMVSPPAMGGTPVMPSQPMMVAPPTTGGTPMMSSQPMMVAPSSMGAMPSMHKVAEEPKAPSAPIMIEIQSSKPVEQKNPPPSNGMPVSIIEMPTGRSEEPRTSSMPTGMPGNFPTGLLLPINNMPSPGKMEQPMMLRTFPLQTPMQYPMYHPTMYSHAPQMMMNPMHVRPGFGGPHLHHGFVHPNRAQINCLDALQSAPAIQGLRFSRGPDESEAPVGQKNDHDANSEAPAGSEHAEFARSEDKESRISHFADEQNDAVNTV